jgi:hypothetical protein
MNSFHRQRLLSGIRNTHRVPIQNHWAYAIRKQARLSLLPLFREILIEWKIEKGIERPYLTELVVELYWGFFHTGSIRMSGYSEVEKIISNFLDSLNKYELGVLGFYYLSDQDVVDTIFQEILDNEEAEEGSPELDDQKVGKVIQNHFQDLNKDDLMEVLMEEMGEIENIFSHFEVEAFVLDAQSIILINEAFSDYLDIPYGEISLIQIPIEEFDYWKKVNAEELETVGKRVQTSNGLEWAECWLLPNGELRVKGNLEDPEERDQATIQTIQTELPELFRLIHEQLKEDYQLLDNQIHYTFFTRRKSLENILPREGIQFFVDEIEAHGADDFEPVINIAIRRYQDKKLEEWGTQISLGIDERLWLSEDETYEFKVWVLALAKEEIPLETRFTDEQKEDIVKDILTTISESYPTRNEA